MDEQVVYDVSAYDLLTPAINDLMDSYPGLDEGEEFSFGQLNESYGKAIFPISGAIIQQMRESITGHIFKMCLYPFTVVYRASGLSESRKVNAKEWLDTLGKWLEKQPVTIDDTVYQLTEYPALSGDAVIEEISRSTPAYLAATNADMSEDWVMTVQARYRIEYDT